MNRGQADDLKAFEQRLTECIAEIRSKSLKWRVLLAGLCLGTSVLLYLWWTDDTNYETYWDMIKAHKAMMLMLAVTFILYIFGITDKNSASNIITARCRKVLHDYNLSCDDHGKLIIKRGK